MKNTTAVGAGAGPGDAGAASAGGAAGSATGAAGGAVSLPSPAPSPFHSPRPLVTVDMSDTELKKFLEEGECMSRSKVSQLGNWTTLVN